MISHQYTPEDALRILMTKLSPYPELYALVQEAIDTGKEDFKYLPEHEDSEYYQLDSDDSRTARTRQSKTHEYRKLARLSAEEALRVAIDVLQAHFVEQPLFVNTIICNMKEIDGIEIDIQTETQFADATNSPSKLERTPDEDLATQRHNLSLLRVLTDFSGE